MIKYQDQIITKIVITIDRKDLDRDAVGRASLPRVSPEHYRNARQRNDSRDTSGTHAVQNQTPSIVDRKPRLSSSSYIWRHRADGRAGKDRRRTLKRDSSRTCQARQTGPSPSAPVGVAR